MRIEWIGVDRRRAKITRGLLWWKRVTYVVQQTAYWHFEASGTKCPHTIDRWIDSKKSAAEEHDRNRGHEAEWARPSRLPRAKVLK